MTQKPELTFSEPDHSTKPETMGNYCLSEREYFAWRHGELPPMVVAGNGWELTLQNGVCLRECFPQLEGAFLRLLAYELSYFEI